MLLSLVYLYAAINIQSLMSAGSVHQDDCNLQQWNFYKILFNKKYASTEEDQSRMKIYFDNAAKIVEHNERFKKGELSFEVGMNQFGDWFSSEFGEISDSFKNIRMQNKNIPVTTSPPLTSKPIPQTKNWVSEGAVSSVKDQGKCGSCWAFATAGVMEGHVFVHNKRQKPVESLSPQNLLDCVSLMDENYSDSCDGGATVHALQYVKKYGIATDKSYPYQGKKLTCKHNPVYVDTQIKSFKKIGPRDVQRKKEVVGVIGPIISSIDSTDFGFRFYKKGLYNSENCSKFFTDHAFVIVGYGTDENGKDYWLVKNSRGVTWGENGFVRVARNDNVCGIETDNIYPEF